jgi:hypothetical protein
MESSKLHITDERLYTGVPLEEADQLLDGQPMTVIADDAFIPEGPIRTSGRTISARGIMSEIVDREDDNDEAYDVVERQANVIVVNPSWIGRVIARVRRQEPTAKVYASVKMGERMVDGGEHL